MEEEVVLYPDTSNEAGEAFADRVNGTFLYFFHRIESEGDRKRPVRGVSSELDPGNPDCLRTFVTLLNFERQFVAHVELVELYVHKLVGVEEEILLLSFDLDEPKALLGEAGNDSCLHMVAYGAPDN